MALAFDAIRQDIMPGLVLWTRERMTNVINATNQVIWLVNVEKVEIVVTSATNLVTWRRIVLRMDDNFPMPAKWLVTIAIRQVIWLAIVSIRMRRAIRVSAIHVSKLVILPAIVRRMPREHVTNVVKSAILGRIAENDFFYYSWNPNNALLILIHCWNRTILS